MPKKRKFGSVDDKCRICLSDDGCMSDIFAEHLRPKIQDFEKSTSISIEDDETLPGNICHVCLYKLDMWVEFKEQFVRSNDALRKHLLLGELMDNGAPVAKRKHSESRDIIAEDIVNAEQDDGKKLKSEPTEPRSKMDDKAEVETELEGVAIDKPATTKDAPEEKPDEVKATAMSHDSEITTDMNPVASTTSPRVKQIVGRRAKTTERRMESTKRWVARKKALLAATGENETDTDSMGSDDDQLSPVQKARAKCNAEKVAETQRRMTTRALHKLNNKLSGCYDTKTESEGQTINESDTKPRKEKSADMEKSEIKKDENGDGRLSSKNIASTSSQRKNSTSNTQNNAIVTNDGSVPKSVRSELIVDGATFVVTSTLVLSEPQYLNSAQTVDRSLLPNNNNNNNNEAAASQEINTDIIDAVQLRRVNPINSHAKMEKKMIDTCLNIEVEGTELEALQRVQTELANFVEKDMRKIIAGDEAIIKKNDGPAKSAFQILDRQLKTIVEKTIRKNLDNTKTIDNRGNNTFRGDFLKAAMRSKIFQPRVCLVRCEVEDHDGNVEIPRKSRSNDLPILPKNSLKIGSKKTLESTPVTLGKRRSVQPAKYADYNTASPFGTDPEDSSMENDHRDPTTDSKSHRSKIHRSSLTKPIMTSQKIQKSLLIAAKPTIPKKSNTTKPTAPPLPNDSPAEKHICGACGESFESREQVEVHFGTHKKPVKQKMMRCKRCHAVVEARHVQSHVCGIAKNVHKCRTCDAAFRNEQLLEKHEQQNHKSTAENRKNDDEATKIETTTTKKIVESNEKNVGQVATKMRDSYTCFVCDATFTDEEILKDHLQKHCDDMSEDERKNVKDYQCAICSESFVTEEILETHVEKHLFDDEDDNPNLITIGGGGVDGEKGSSRPEMIHSCGQCSENFDSEMLLMLHMQAHEEEVAIAEWERRGIDNNQVEQHVCVICDDLFATEDELSEHLDIHNGNAHICFLCDKPFITLEELQSHVNTH